MRWQTTHSGTLVAMVIAVGAVVCGAGVARAADSTAPERVVASDAQTCPATFGRTLIEELGSRTSVHLVLDGTTDETSSPWRLRWGASGQKLCKVRLERPGQTDTFVVERNADRLEIASVATRIAWIIDGGGAAEATPARDEERATPSEEESEEMTAAAEAGTPSPGEADVAEEMSSGSSVVEDDGPRFFRVSAAGGSMWIPSAGASVLMTTVGVRLQPWDAVQFGLRGRLPLDTVQTEVAGTRFDYRPWSAELVTAWAPHFSGWSIEAGGGVRWTIAQLSVTDVSRGGMADDVLEQTPARVTGDPDIPSENALSAWSAVAMLGVQRRVVDWLALRLDVTGAGSLTRRRVRNDDRVLMELGRFDVDALLGLELRF